MLTQYLETYRRGFADRHLRLINQRSNVRIMMQGIALPFSQSVIIRSQLTPIDVERDSALKLNDEKEILFKYFEPVKNHLQHQQIHDTLAFYDEGNLLVNQNDKLSLFSIRSKKVRPLKAFGGITCFSYAPKHEIAAITIDLQHIDLFSMRSCSSLNSSPIRISSDLIGIAKIFDVPAPTMFCSGNSKFMEMMNLESMKFTRFPIEFNINNFYYDEESRFLCTACEPLAPELAATTPSFCLFDLRDKPQLAQTLHVIPANAPHPKRTGSSASFLSNNRLICASENGYMSLFDLRRSETPLAQLKTSSIVFSLLPTHRPDIVAYSQLTHACGFLFLNPEQMEAHVEGVFGVLSGAAVSESGRTVAFSLPDINTDYPGIGVFDVL